MRYNTISYMRTLTALLVAALAALGAVSCDKYLDVTPDNRAELKNGDDISNLLVSAYPQTAPCEIGEMSSDNTDHNVNSEGSWTTFNILQEKLARWQDTSETGEDSPYNMWESWYIAISACNEALAAISNLGDSPDLQPQKGEALICRAYCHFMLANVFCREYSPKTASQDLGIPYMLEAETTVSPNYVRGTVADVYAHIADDIQAALPLISDDVYSVPKYHFNRKAAYAFAARFWLYYMQEDLSNLDKAIEYATECLGPDPGSVMRDWKTVGALSPNDKIRSKAFADAAEQANLLLISTYSAWNRVYGPWSLGLAYTHNTLIAETESCKAAGFWGNSDVFYFSVPQYTDLPKVMMDKMAEFFEYIDAVQGIGYVHIMYPAFTTDECLLNRAEAYALKGEYSSAYSDLTVWMNHFTSNSTKVSARLLQSTYGDIAYYTPESPTPKKRLNPDFPVAQGEQENLIQAILHARRVLCLHEGLRWFDIKRYGIEIYRRTVRSDAVTEVYDTLSKDDPRRAIQLPSSVIAAGMEPNPRN